MVTKNKVTAPPGKPEKSQLLKKAGLDTEIKLTPFLPPPHNSSPPKVFTYIGSPWPKWGAGSAPSVSLSELPSRSLRRNTGTPCWRTGEDRVWGEQASLAELGTVTLLHPSDTNQGIQYLLLDWVISVLENQSASQMRNIISYWSEIQYEGPLLKLRISSIKRIVLI